MDEGLISELKDVGVVEFLHADSRPTFLLDLDPDAIPGEDYNLLKPVFCNTALRSHATLLDIINGETDVDPPDVADREVSYYEFKEWATSVSKHDDTVEPFPVFFLFCGMLWTGSTVRKRWRVISGNQCYRSTDVSSGNLSSGPPSEIAMARKKNLQNKTLSKQLSQSTASITDRIKEIVSFSDTQTASDALSLSTAQDSTNSNKSDVINEEYLDNPTPAPVTLLGASDWTADELNGEVSSHVAFVRQVNWASTALGPMSTVCGNKQRILSYLECLHKLRCSFLRIYRGYYKFLSFTDSLIPL